MDKFDRIQQLHRLFSERKTAIPLKELAAKLECSEKTIRRSLDTLRDFTHAPLEYVERLNGWRYNPDAGNKFELPGIWLTNDEIHSLSIILHLTQSMDASLLSRNLAPIEKSVDQLLRSRNVDPVRFRQQIRYLPKTHRPTAGKDFHIISDALFAGLRLKIRYTDYSGQTSKREISPLKLVHYQENWYLDAWCHLRNNLRSFMIARIESVKATETPAEKIDPEAQQAHFASSYGIFAGEATQTAQLVFTNAAAREAASYQWHPEQIRELAFPTQVGMNSASGNSDNGGSNHLFNAVDSISGSCTAAALMAFGCQANLLGYIIDSSTLPHPQKAASSGVLPPR
jgi:predicted DNA-binding transcriptional regulator YafY